jgi:hypothetical protein
MKEKKKGKRRKKKKGKRRKGKNRKRKKKRNREKFRKLGEFLGEIRRGMKKDFCGFFWVSQMPALIPGRR